MLTAPVATTFALTSSSLNDARNGEPEMKLVLVPVFMFLSSCLMALAWLGHLRFRNHIGFWTALGASWLLVLPEYVSTWRLRGSDIAHTTAPRWLPFI